MMGYTKTEIVNNPDFAVTLGETVVPVPAVEEPAFIGPALPVEMLLERLFALNPNFN